MKRVVPLLFVLVSLGIAGTPSAELKLDVPYTRFTLSNGLEVILHEDHTTPTVAVNTWYHVGSGREKPGRTGFAHLFEHLMFKGSANVPDGMFDQWLEAAGGNNNGSTTGDRTNYYETVPSSALELPLFLESDRLGGLLPTMSQEKLDNQRDVVKNERRQNYENRPYGMAWVILAEASYPPGHPYHWPTIGYQEDLSAASLEDVAGFFRTWYVPNNTSIVVAGDIEPAAARKAVEKWFGDIPRGAPVPPVDPVPAVLSAEKRLVFEDKVQLPRLYMSWISPPLFAPGDAELDLVAGILAGGKSSRLYRRLVYELQVAQDVSAFQDSNALTSNFIVIATARAGHGLAELEKVVQEELDRLATEPPATRELERAVNRNEAAFLRRLESLEGKADQLNSYFVQTGNPDYFAEDFARFQPIGTKDLTAAAATWLKRDARVVLSIVPKGKKELASGEGQEVEKR